MHLMHSQTEIGSGPSSTSLICSFTNCPHAAIPEINLMLQHHQEASYSKQVLKKNSVEDETELFVV